MTGAGGKRGRLKRTLREHGWLLGLVLLALVVPRAVPLATLEVTLLRPTDVASHLLRLDQVAKSHLLDERLRSDPYYRRAFGPLVIWPDGIYRVAAPLARCLGLLSGWMTGATNLLFTLVLSVGVVGLGLAAGGLRLGLWGLVLTLLAPPLVVSGWYFGPDLPLVAMTTVGLLLLWHTRLYSRLFPCLLFGLWSGLGLLVKPTYAIYLLLPSFACLVLGLRAHRPRYRPPVNALVALALALGLFVLLQGIDQQELLAILSLHVAKRDLPAARFFDPWTPAWFLSYPLFAALSFPLPLLVLALPGLIRVHFGPNANPLRWLWLAMLWGCYVSLTLLHSKLERYLHPVYPVVCLIIAWGVLAMVPGRWRRGVMAMVAVLFAALLAVAHWSPLPWGLGPAESYRQLPFREALQLPPYDELLGRFEIRLPSPEERERLRRFRFHVDCRLDRLVRTLHSMARAERTRRPVGVVVIPSGPDQTSLDYLRHSLAALLLAQGVKDRLVFSCNGVEEAQDAWMDSNFRPALLLLHVGDQDWHKDLPGSRIVANRSVRLDCNRPHMVQVTLLVDPRSGARVCRKTR